jgi:thiol-disulfide isomerase/thioredoxin
MRILTLVSAIAIGATSVTLAVPQTSTPSRTSTSPQPPAAQQAPAPLVAPKTTGATPAACLQEVRDFVSAKQKELQAGLPPAPAITPGQPLSEAEMVLLRQRSTQVLAISQRITPLRLAMTRECAAKFDLATAPDAELTALVELYSDAGDQEKATAAVERALALKGQSPEQRAPTLSMAVTMLLRQEKGEARNARLEAIVDEMDRLPAAFFDRKFAAHQSMNGYYRYDDIDAGIIKHSTWIIEAGRGLAGDVRAKYGSGIISAYVNMAQAWAGQGRNDEAIALMRRAITDWPEVPSAAARVQPEIERLMLVGTPGAPLTAPRWLNTPADLKSLDLKGSVTLLEFTAHWCVPCKESYPGVTRLLEKYGPRGFRVVLSTQMYGYFETERDLTPEVEFERDRTYFAGHGMNVPIAVADRAVVKVVDGRAQSSASNDANYRVGGIPQIHLIDKQGRIRLVMVGYDDANEATLAKMIEDLLKQ